MPKVEMRLLRESDIVAFVAFRKQAAIESEYINATTVNKVKILLNQAISTVTIVTVDNKIVGQLIVKRTPTKHSLQLISVLRCAKGLGVGNLLINKAVDEAVVCGVICELLVSSKNIKAKNFYKKYGFVYVQRIFTDSEVWQYNLPE